MKTRVVLTTVNNRIIAVPAVNTPSRKPGDNTVLFDILVARANDIYEYYLPYPDGRGYYYKATINTGPLKDITLRISLFNELRLSGFTGPQCDYILKTDDLALPHAQAILNSIMLPRKWHFGFKDYNYEYCSPDELGIRVRSIDSKKLSSVASPSGTQLFKYDGRNEKSLKEGVSEFFSPKELIKNVVTISEETNHEKEVAMDNAKNKFPLDGVDPKGLMSSLIPVDLLSKIDFDNEWSTKIEPYIREVTAKVKNNAGKIVAGAALTALIIKLAEAYSDVLKFKFSRTSERKYNEKILKKNGFNVDNLLLTNEEQQVVRDIGMSTALFGLEYNDVMFFKDSFKITSFNPSLSMGQIDKLSAQAELAINDLIEAGYEDVVKDIIRTGAKYENSLVDNGEGEGLLHNSLHYLSMGPLMPKCSITIMDLIYLKHAARQI